MFKQVWRSYLASLHPRNYKYIKNPGIELLWFCFMINPLINSPSIENIADRVEVGLFWITVLLPYYIMWWSDLGHKLSMPKMMYVLPMKQEGRKEYLNTLMVIKIGFPTLVHVILQIIRAIIYKIDVVQFLNVDVIEIILSTFAVISFGIGRYVCSQLRSKFDRYIKYAVRGKDGTGKDAWLNWMCMIYAVIYRVFVMMVESERGPLGWLEWIYILGFLSIMVIFDIAIIKTRYQATIEDVCDYEEAFNILGRVKK